MIGIDKTIDRKVETTKTSENEKSDVIILIICVLLYSLNKYLLPLKIFIIVKSVLNSNSIFVCLSVC